MVRHNEYASKHIKTLPSQPNKKTTKTKQDSSTRVNTVFSGPRVVFGARVNEKLKKRFVEVAKREYGSVCRLQEAFMAAVLAVSPLKVNSSKTVHIEKIVIERNLRPRRRLEVREEGPSRRRGNHYSMERGWFFDPELDPGMLVVEQPKEWGKTRGAEGFTWNERKGIWWKNVENGR